MAVFQNAITGFNVNIPRRGKSYHVQTEDSGVNNPHVITHLFIGGNIIATVKTSYDDILDSPDLTARVRTLMEEQHKAMIRDLLNGKFDEKAASSVQLHAPKVDMLTPFQAPVAIPKPGAKAKEDKPEGSLQPTPPQASQEAPQVVPEKTVQKKAPEAHLVTPEELAQNASDHVSSETSPEEVVPPEPALSPEEALQRAVEAYFAASQALAVGSLSSPSL